MTAWYGGRCPECGEAAWHVGDETMTCTQCGHQILRDEAGNLESAG